MNIGPLSLLVLQPTPFCNINCSYCYLADRNVKRSMSDEVLTCALRRAFSSGLIAGEIDILWHAGEPLVVGTDFYWEAASKIANFNVNSARVSQCIQTNGTLIDAEWCDLFKACNFKVGVSLDGPESINDAHRRTRRSTGTFRAVMRGISALRHHGVDFSILAVLTRESLSHIDEVLDFFEREGLNKVGFNLEEIEGAHSDWSFGIDDNPLDLYREFARTAAARHARGSLAIREIAAIERRLGSTMEAVVGPVRPLQFVTVDIDGGFSTYCPELHGFSYGDGTKHVFGNVITDDFLDILANPRFLHIYDEVMTGVARCAQECHRFGICGSHRVANKFFENGTFSSTETIQCQARIKIVADIVEAEKKCRDNDVSAFVDARRKLNGAAPRNADHPQTF